ncbi:receptor-like protein 6 [Gastrolobium bilobum]|uniref:receptor-like protein 6 n=1 Tax=Gastrolobium bilobum TaxID=150636 RepID=UPI002AB03676|nr:receptor-like protein 6 [Gastrolobium bilobum]
MGWFLLPYFIQCLLLLLFPSYSCSLLPLCNHDDNSALLQFKNSFALDTYHPFPSSSSSLSSYKTASWKNGTDCCQWDGITCDAMSGHVIGLDLSCNNLVGEFHPNSTIFKLKHLQQLNLAFNNFSGSSIYSGIGDLVKLTHLNLSHSSLSGDIPSTISHLSNLISLDLSDYSREISKRVGPSTWKKLILNATHLRELVMDGVDMSSIRESSLSLLMNLSSSLVSLSLRDTGLQGNLPTDILCLPYLQELWLSGNEKLRGQLPKSNWSTHLRYLDLSSIAFSGEIPSSIGHLKSLNTLGLTGCNLHGSLPLSLWNLTQLTFLSLPYNNLNGEIPSLLSNLKHLTSFDLQSNNFTGHIPDVFAMFINLEFFSLSSNNLTGQIPSSLFNLTQLSHLDLANNKLVGPIPSKITKLSKLSLLALAFNMLNGTIPHWCYSLPLLTELDLNDNQLTGSISEFSTYSLKYLFFSNNKLQGNFPNSIFDLENITDLGLSSTELSGLVDFHRFSKFKNLIFLDLSHNSFLSINFHSSVDYFLSNIDVLYLSSCNMSTFPKFLERVQNLQELDLSNNKIHGKIPKWFNEKLLLSWKDIQYIDLSFNMLQGDLPIPPYGIQFFSVSNNNLTGDISSTICNASSLYVLNLAHNNLSGMIPQCLGTFPYLSVLDLQMNNLHGRIPRNFSKGNAFQTIKLNGNRLEGPLPESLAYCTFLQVLDLGDNNIEDTFPSWLETLQELQVLSLRSNKLHGVITCSSTKHPFPKLRIFDVSNNKFSGPLPASCIKNFQRMMNVNEGQTGLKYMNPNTFYNDSVVVIMKGQYMELVRILTTFTTIDLSNNMFEGEIPSVVGELNSLKGLNLSHNGITGTIPQSLSNLRNLEWLDLSWNQLTGEIPTDLTNLNFLEFLNLSQNQFEGIIPTGRQFNTFENDSYEGNPLLCGLPLTKSCNKDEELPPHSTFDHEEESGFGWKAVVVGYACGMVFGMLLGCNVFITGKPQWLARLFEGMLNERLKRTNNRARANRGGRN